MRLQAGELHYVYAQFLKYLASDAPGMEVIGDQDWIYAQVREAKLWPPEKVVSFKLDLAPRVKPGEDVPLTDDCAVAVFHGKPDPLDVLDRPLGPFGRAPFVREHWR